MAIIKFKVDDVLPKLMQVAQVAGQKNLIRILDYVLFDVYDVSTLTLTSSDNETWLTVMAQVEADNDAIGRKFCIESQMAINALRMLGGEEVVLELNDTTNTATGKYKNGKFEIPFMGGNEYPVQGSGDEPNITKMDAQRLRELVLTPMFAVGNDDLRPAMNCIRLDFTEQDVVSVGTDAHTLVKYTQNKGVGFNDGGVSIPSKPASVLANLLASMPDGVDVQVGFNETHFSVHTDNNFSLATRIVTIKYPNYNMAIPKNNNIVAVVDKTNILSALKRVTPFGNQKTCAVALEFNNNNIHVSARDIDYSTSAAEDVDCEYQNEPLTIGFSGTALIDAIKNCPNATDGKIAIHMESPSRAAVITPNEQKEGTEYICMVMPMIVE